MDARRKRLIEKRLAAKEAKRFHAFYRGVLDWRQGRKINPFSAGSELARCWENGQEYAQAEQVEDAQTPVCRFGPGGDYVQDWPEGEL